MMQIHFELKTVGEREACRWKTYLWVYVDCFEQSLVHDGNLRDSIGISSRMQMGIISTGLPST